MKTMCPPGYHHHNGFVATHARMKEFKSTTQRNTLHEQKDLSVVIIFWEGEQFLFLEKFHHIPFN